MVYCKSPFMRSRLFPLPLFALIVSIAVVNFLAEIYSWYWRMRWFDAPMHFAGGIWLAATVLWIQYERKGRPLPNFYKILVVSLVAAVGIGFLWEIFEALLSLKLLGHINAMPDTLGDLFFDTLGGIAAAVWVNRYKK